MKITLTHVVLVMLLLAGAIAVIVFASRRGNTSNDTNPLVITPDAQTLWDSTAGATASYTGSFDTFLNRALKSNSGRKLSI